MDLRFSLKFFSQVFKILIVCKVTIFNLLPTTAIFMIVRLLFLLLFLICCPLLPSLHGSLFNKNGFAVFFGTLLCEIVLFVFFFSFYVALCLLVYMV